MRCAKALFRLSGLCLAAAAGLTPGDAAAQNRDACRAAQLVSAVGALSIRAADGRGVDVAGPQWLCPGDTISTGADGQATLRAPDAQSTPTAAAFEYGASIRLDANSSLVIPPERGAQGLWLQRGELYFISTVRSLFTIRTDHVTAGIDGTEAVIAHLPGAGSVVAPIEGDIALNGAGEGGSVSAADGTVGFAPPNGRLAILGPGDADRLPIPFKDYLVRPDGIADWAVHIPADALDRDLPPDALALLRAGRPAEAATALACNARPTDSPACSLIAVALNRRGAMRAIAGSPAPRDGGGWIARSYVHQGLGDLDAALAAAAAASPETPWTRARLAEMQLLVGDPGAALRTLGPAPAGCDDIGHLSAVRGFAALSTHDHGAAAAAFDCAIAATPAAPLPWLGQGLLKIRAGRLAEGRASLETALSLDPRRAMIRTWLGRAFVDEGYGDKAAAQFALARREDPDDPTPDLFAALERFGANDPVAALRLVEDAGDRGDRRASLRSARGLSEDRAVVGAALGRIYQVLGFDSLAIAEAARAVDEDPGNPGAHRFLAEMYRGRRGHEIARSSEHLRANLLSPPSSTPLEPQLGESDLYLMAAPGPARATFSEFSPLFDADGLRFDVSGTGGTQDSWGQEAAVTVLHEGFSLSLAEFTYDTDGFAPNNDLRHELFGARATIAATPWLTLYGEYRNRRTEGGDLTLDFDGNATPGFRQKFTREFGRFGAHAAIGPDTDLLGVVTIGELAATNALSFPGYALTNTVVDETADGQVQLMHRRGNSVLTVGGAFATTDFTTTSVEVVEAIPPFLPRTEEIRRTDREATQGSLYAYLVTRAPRDVEWTFGLSLDTVDIEGSGGYSRTEASPKFGVRFALTDAITLRAAYTRTLKPRIVTDERLEPTSVAGFNQFFDAPNGTTVDRIGAAIDVRAAPDLWLGAEIGASRWDIPTFDVGFYQTEDLTARIYADKTFAKHWSLALEGRYEQSTSDFDFDLDSFSVASARATLSYFDPAGWFVSGYVEPVWHDYEDDGDNGSSNFVMTGISAGWRLPDNRGVLSLTADNLFDQTVRFQDRTYRRSALATPRFTPALTVTARATFKF